MKKTIISILTAVLAVSTLTHTSIASAEEKPTQSAPSKATVTFEVPTKSVEPLNPVDGTSLLDVDHDGNSTNYGGPLSLDYVSNLSFSKKDESLEITSKTMHYKSVSRQPFVQVSDFRGTGAGWRLTASAAPFTSDSEDGNTLIGSSISLIDGSFTSPDGGNEPKFNNEPINIGNDTNVQAVQLETDNEPVAVITANAKIATETLSQSPGQGTWLMKWFNELTEDQKNPNVLLTVLGNTASPGNHTSVITWTLENGPNGPVDIEKSVVSSDENK